MRDKRIKVIYFSLRGSEVKNVELGWKKILVLFGCFFSFLLLIVGLILAIFTDFYHNNTIASLNRINTALKQKLLVLGEKVSEIESKIVELEEQDDELRVIVDLPKIDNRNVGSGGTRYGFDYELNLIPKESREKTIEFQKKLDMLERRMQLVSESYRKITMKFENNKHKLDHTPSIKPVVRGRMTDRFGMRLDPFIEKIRPHKGIDFAAERGTEVYATAYGVVEKVKRKFFPNKGYGKEIIINHGYGFKTRYAHLSKILVKEGQRVNRWDIIGEVGATGRTTGPHLHYEVIVSGKAQDPDKYILN